MKKFDVTHAFIRHNKKDGHPKIESEKIYKRRKPSRWIDTDSMRIVVALLKQK